MRRTQKSNHKTSRGWELFRFIVCGIAAALADYLFCQLFVLIFNNSFNSYAITAITTLIGFIAGVIVNYFLSTFWVYQNVDSSVQTKSKKFIMWFVILSLVATLLSIGTMLLCNLVVKSCYGVNIVSISIIDLIKQHGINFLCQFEFWAYFWCFCIKTIVGLVFNYFTRKYILYKAPKTLIEKAENGK